MKNLTSEQGIRVFYSNDAFEDYDPVSVFEQTGDLLIIEGGGNRYELHDVDKVYEYRILDTKIDGIYIRVFDNAAALQYEADKMEGELK